MAKASIGGYPAKNGTELHDGQGRVIGRGIINKCTKVRPHERGAWISGERCSYWFKIDGTYYSCRGRGDGIAASCTPMKKPPKVRGFPLRLDGVKPRKRRR